MIVQCGDALFSVPSLKFISIYSKQPSHLQGSEHCPEDWLAEMYMLKLKTFVWSTFPGSVLYPLS